MIDTMTQEPASFAAVTDVRFIMPLPGFPEARNFTIEPLDDQTRMLCILRCTDEENLEFVIAMPGAFFPDYEPELDDNSAERLGLVSAEDALVFVILTVAERIEQSTANLFAPVVVNRTTGEAIQALLVNSDYDIRTPLVG